MNPDLADLIAPLSLAKFVKTHWERRSLYQRGDAGRFDAVFDRERLFAAAQRPTGPHAGDPRRLKAGFRDLRGEHAEVSITPAQVAPLLAAGMTIQAEWLHESDPELAEFVAGLRRSFAAPLEVDVAAFLSPTGSGYGLHFDTTSMFILQLEGTKRWHYGKAPAVERPEHNLIPDAAARAAGVHGFSERDLVVQELSPGDMLYLPAGTWHHVCATSESLHVCITLRPVSVLDLAHDLLVDDLLSEVSGRALPSALGGLASEADERARFEAIFAGRLEALRAAVGRLTPAALYDAWIARTEGEEDEAPIAPDDVLEHDEPLRWRRVVAEDGEDLVEVLVGEGVAAMPGHAEAFLKKLAATPKFRAEVAKKWVEEYPWDDVAMLLREFVSLGVLRRGQ
jgi:hypothetical protein